MSTSCLSRWLVLLFLLLPATAIARSNKDADAVVTIRNGRPCFSYPQDSVIRKRQHSFGYLSISRNGPLGGEGWEIGVESFDRKGLVEPDSPERCIEYGVMRPGLKVKQPADPLLYDTPYKVFIDVTQAPGETLIYDRKFALDFCVTRNGKGEVLAVEASVHGSGRWTCLKLGETKRRGIWEWLFGK